MSVYFYLMLEFFKTGLFAVGGGLATVPFLFDLIDKYHWFTTSTLANMIAISESTPGAMGVNMATYVGYQVTKSPLGAITTTLSLVAPSIIIITIIAHYLRKFRDSKIIQAMFYGLRPAVSAMIAVAGISIFMTTMFPTDSNTFDGFSFCLFLILFLFHHKFDKIHPIVLIVMSACIGIIFQL